MRCLIGEDWGSNWVVLGWMFAFFVLAWLLNLLAKEKGE